MTNDSAVKCRDKLPDRLRLHIVDMARRRDDNFHKQPNIMSATVSRMDATRLRRKDTTSTKMQCSTYPVMTHKSTDLINLDLIRGHDMAENFVSPREQNVKEVNSSTTIVCERGNSHDIKPEFDDFGRYRAEKCTKPFIYDEINSPLPTYSNLVPMYHVSDMKVADSITCSVKPHNIKSAKIVSTEVITNVNKKEPGSPPRQKATEQYEIKGSAFLTPRNLNSFTTTQSVQRTGLFSASLIAIRRRRYGQASTMRKQVFKKERDCVEDYVIRVEKEEKWKPNAKNENLKSGSPRESQQLITPRQNRSSTVTLTKRETGEPSCLQTIHVKKTENTYKSPSPVNAKIDCKGYSSLYEDESISSDEQFKCSYRLPEGNGLQSILALPQKPLLKTDQQLVSNVKTYVLESNDNVQSRPELAPLTSHNLQVHDSIILSANQKTKSPLQRFSIGSFNTTPNSNGLYQSDFLEPLENERISAWLSGVVVDSNLPAPSLNPSMAIVDASSSSIELVQCLQSCHGANGSALSLITKPAIRI